jgi:hypothetical protein
LFHSRQSAISGQLGNLAGSCRSSSDVERANANYYEVVSQLAPATNITSHDANWEDYEDLLDPLGEANGPLISNNEVKLRVLTQISTGENLLIFEGFYLDGRVPLGGGFDVSFRRAVWIFIIGRSRQLDTVGEFQGQRYQRLDG